MIEHAGFAVLIVLAAVGLGEIIDWHSRRSARRRFGRHD